MNSSPWTATARSLGLGPPGHRGSCSRNARSAVICSRSATTISGGLVSRKNMYCRLDHFGRLWTVERRSDPCSFAEHDLSTLGNIARAVLGPWTATLLLINPAATDRVCSGPLQSGKKIRVSTKATRASARGQLAPDFGFERLPTMVPTAPGDEADRPAATSCSNTRSHRRCCPA